MCCVAGVTTGKIAGLFCGLAGFQEQLTGLGVNGYSGKSREEAVAQKARFTLKDWLVMQAGRDALKLMSADLNRGFDLWDGDSGQADGRLAVAIWERDVGGHPLKRRRTAGVQSHPLGFVIVD